MKTQIHYFIYIGVVINFSLVSQIIVAQTTGYFVDNRDGRKYRYIQIGSQTWMAENLNYEIKTGSMCYNNEQAKCAIYGRLYTWKVAMKACPNGWHLPSRSDFDKLFEYLGGSSVAGGKLKESGNVHWNSPNGEATNRSGFNALPGGEYSMGDFSELGKHGFFITTTIEQPVLDPLYTSVWMVNLNMYQGEASYGILQIYSDEKASVRCIKSK